MLQNFEGEFTVDDFGNMEEAPCLNGQYKLDERERVCVCEKITNTHA